MNTGHFASGRFSPSQASGVGEWKKPNELETWDIISWYLPGIFFIDTHPYWYLFLPNWICITCQRFLAFSLPHSIPEIEVTHHMREGYKSPSIHTQDRGLPGGPRFPLPGEIPGRSKLGLPSVYRREHRPCHLVWAIRPYPDSNWFMAYLVGVTTLPATFSFSFLSPYPPRQWIAGS